MLHVSPALKNDSERNSSHADGSSNLIVIVSTEVSQKALTRITIYFFQVHISSCIDSETRFFHKKCKAQSKQDPQNVNIQDTAAVLVSNISGNIQKSGEGGYSIKKVLYVHKKPRLASLGAGHKGKNR